MKKRILAVLVSAAVVLSMTACSENNEDLLDSTTPSNQSSTSIVDSTSLEDSTDSTSSESESSSKTESSSIPEQSSSAPQSSSAVQSSKPQSSSTAQSSKPQSSSAVQSSKPIDIPSVPASSKIDWSKVPVVDEMDLDYKIIEPGDIRYDIYYEWYRDEMQKMCSNGCVVITKYFGDAKYIKLPDQIEGKRCIFISSSVNWGANAKAIKFSEGCANPVQSMQTVSGNRYNIDLGSGRNITEAVVPDSWKFIDGFSSMPNLETVNIPKETRNILRGAFSGCSKFKNITIPENIENIGENAFKGCTSLEINFPKKLSGEAVLGGNCFAGCTSLTTVELPEGFILEINAQTGHPNGRLFSGCTSLKKVSVPRSMKYVPEFMFSGCNSLTDVKLADGIEKINEAAFGGCTSLKSIDIPDSVTYISSSVFFLRESDITVNYKGKTYNIKNLGKICDRDLSAM